MKHSKQWLVIYMQVLSIYQFPLALVMPVLSSLQAKCKIILDKSRYAVGIVSYHFIVVKVAIVFLQILLTDMFACVLVESTIRCNVYHQQSAMLCSCERSREL